MIANIIGVISLIGALFFLGLSFVPKVKADTMRWTVLTGAVFLLTAAICFK